MGRKKRKRNEAECEQKKRPADAVLIPLLSISHMSDLHFGCTPVLALSQSWHCLSLGIVSVLALFQLNPVENRGEQLDACNSMIENLTTTEGGHAVTLQTVSTNNSRHVKACGKTFPTS